MLDAIEKDIYTRSAQVRLLRLEQEQAELEDKIAYEESHQLKPHEKSKIVEFLKIYTNKKFKSKRDRNDFFNNFISRVNLFDDRITIVYNTSQTSATEIYNRPENESDDDSNGGVTTIYSKTIEISEIGSNLDCRRGLNANPCNQSLSKIQNDVANEFVTDTPKTTQQKSRSNSCEFKRQLFGGEIGIRTPGSSHYDGFQVFPNKSPLRLNATA